MDKTATNSREFPLYIKGKKVNIYPNPLKGNLLSIDLEGYTDSDLIDVLITNIQGQKVYSKSMEYNHRIVIDTKGMLRNSIYLLSVKSGDSMLTTKLIVE